MKLRPYQEQDVHRIRLALRKTDRVLYCLPTGGGKTVIFSHIATGASGKGNPVTILAHRREIVDQISTALDRFGIRHGIIAPGLRLTRDLVQVGMVQTVARRLPVIPRPRLLVLDEAHHAVAGSWRKVSDAWAGTKILGVTATPERLDGKPLGDCFDDLLVGPGVLELIQMGYLAPFDYYAPPQKAELNGVKKRAGDYAIDELSRAMDRATITGDAVDHYSRILRGRPSIVFCCTIAHAERVASAFSAAGYRAASIDGSMSREERMRRLTGLANGSLNVLTSADLISEGVDVPAVAGAILLRPTQSLTIYLQQVGRALRLKPDGSRAVILDHVGNAARHGPPDKVRDWSLAGRKKDDAPGLRTCRKCYRAILVGTPVECPDAECGLKRQIGGGDGRPAPKVVDGELRKLEDPLAWANGIDIVKARGAEWQALLDLAGDNLERLRQIARLRNYHWKWAVHTANAYKARRALIDADFPTFGAA